MNYQKIYSNLIAFAQTGKYLTEHIEHHHIIPKCLNGKDDKSNMV